jgi:SAM-dependent methyltransferase
MTWTWARPADDSVLDGRPLLDLGTGDGQTLASLSAGGLAGALVVGLDQSPRALRAAKRTGIERLICAVSDDLPIRSASIATVLAADLFHHLPDERLARAMAEVRRVLRPGGRLVAWWYERSGRPGRDAPAYPRPYRVVADAVASVGMEAQTLELEFSIEPVPPTTGVVATAVG